MKIIFRIEEEKDASNKTQKVAFVTIKSNDNILDDINAIAVVDEYPQLAIGIDGLVKNILKLKQEQVKDSNKKKFEKKLLAKKQK